MKVLITGGGGFIGKNLTEGLNEYDVTSITRDDFDLTDTNSVNKFFKGKNFDVVIHTAIIGGDRMVIDSDKTLTQNLLLFNNLMDNESHFKKLINFGSGAETHSPNSPYGISKKIISDNVSKNEGFYNIVIFATFNENELNSRFIKANMLNYINKKPMIIHRNKYMDFFYMTDLITLVKFYLNNNVLPKSIDCSYQKKVTLKDIADMINNLSDYKVPIIIEESGLDKSYIGNDLFLKDLSLNLIGLEEGIRRTYISYK